MKNVRSEWDVNKPLWTERLYQNELNHRDREKKTVP